MKTQNRKEVRVMRENSIRPNNEKTVCKLCKIDRIGVETVIELKIHYGDSGVYRAVYVCNDCVNSLK
jgi:hypothetical protein